MILPIRHHYGDRAFSDDATKVLSKLIEVPAPSRGEAVKSVAIVLADSLNPQVDARKCFDELLP